MFAAAASDSGSGIANSYRRHVTATRTEMIDSVTAYVPTADGSYRRVRMGAVSATANWEIAVPELNTSVFVIPGGLVKNREDRLIVLNQVAVAVVNARRGIHPEFVFSFRGVLPRNGRRTHKPLCARGPGEPLDCMNNGGWQEARKRAAAKYAARFGRPAPWGFAHVRVHDLKHTFGRRLRAAGVGAETRKALLGHTNGDITTHYSAAELAELINAVNKIDRSLATPALTLLKAA